MNTLIQTFKQVTRRLTPQEMAARELAAAELAKLEAETAVEYAQSIVIYNERRIKRLRGFLAQGDKE